MLEGLCTVVSTLPYEAARYILSHRPLTLGQLSLPLSRVWVKALPQRPETSLPPYCFRSAEGRMVAPIAEHMKQVLTTGVAGTTAGGVGQGTAGGSSAGKDGTRKLSAAIIDDLDRLTVIVSTEIKSSQGGGLGVEPYRESVQAVCGVEVWQGRRTKGE